MVCRSGVYKCQQTVPAKLTICALVGAFSLDVPHISRRLLWFDSFGL